MDLCEEVAGGRYRGEDVAPSLRAAALDCWSLLATTLNDLEVSGDGTGRGMALLPLLAGCLDQPDAGLRRSAGEALALIHECRLGLGLTDDEGANATDRRYGRGRGRARVRAERRGDEEHVPCGEEEAEVGLPGLRGHGRGRRAARRGGELPGGSGQAVELEGDRAARVGEALPPGWIPDPGEFPRVVSFRDGCLGACIERTSRQEPIAQPFSYLSRYLYCVHPSGREPQKAHDERDAPRDLLGHLRGLRRVAQPAREAPFHVEDERGVEGGGPRNGQEQEGEGQRQEPLPHDGR
ncbi:hypothetical protein THAOC_18927 [Thalassiosira oceanica]|uniref:Interferon-related developmental regulator N-terminal domain-containing protein n=1 Tax=Thalassiosira oceanica TaxID=159749 RepID=K0S3R1_THAOC|nr:hypothetical protein THAOC_18927 [Thalassiosira oceanica]|eukprot:EJK60678.1 hypothetical protein THAOC_18927 [Thalassiosira oceanica]